MTTNKDCLIYMRTSTLTNKDGDSVHRQKSSIMKWENLMDIKSRENIGTLNLGRQTQWTDQNL